MSGNNLLYFVQKLAELDTFTQEELREQIGISQSQISRNVNTAVSFGLVERTNQKTRVKDRGSPCRVYRSLVRLREIQSKLFA